MPHITWISEPISLGTITEFEFYEHKLNAVSSDGSAVEYFHWSGDLPSGIQINRSGSIQGVPVITQTGAQQPTTELFLFTVRATSDTGAVSDRGFTLRVHNLQGVAASPREVILDDLYDGSLISHQLEAISKNPYAKLVWKFLDNQAPRGLTLTPDGLLSGMALPLILDNTDRVGYDTVPNDFGDFDLVDQGAGNSVREFQFKVSVTDGYSTDIATVIIKLINRSFLTADNAYGTADLNKFPWFVNAHQHGTLVTTKPSEIPVMEAGSFFAHQFKADDFEGDELRWGIEWIGGINSITLSEIPSGSNVIRIQERNGIEIGMGIYIGDIEFDSHLYYYGTTQPLDPYTTIVGISQVAEVDTFGRSSFQTVLHLDRDVVKPIRTNAFVKILPNQTARLANLLTIDNSNGWLTGVLPKQSTYSHTYQFKVHAYMQSDPRRGGAPVAVNLKTVQRMDETIRWITPSVIRIQNGEVSSLQIKATTTRPGQLTYRLADYPSSGRLPQGLTLHSNGDIVGRVSFQMFDLDGVTSQVQVTSTEYIHPGMYVQGAGVPAGSRIKTIKNSTTFTMSPAVTLNPGQELTIGDLLGSQTIVRVVEPSADTAIDHDLTTFDSAFKANIIATSADGAISDQHEFTIVVERYNTKPYENLYLRATPDLKRRNLLKGILENTTIFPDDLIYRIDDPNFGKAKDIRVLFAAGMNPTILSEYVDAMSKNHYTKTILFSDIKTARAVDEFLNPVYEVVYLEINDQETAGGISAPAEIYVNSIQDKIYPNSFINMMGRLEEHVGYANKGALPLWMKCVQEDLTVLGFKRVFVLAYTIPGASKYIAKRIAEANVDFNYLDFIVDRYSVDTHYSKNYLPMEDRFDTDNETTFDVMGDDLSLNGEVFIEVAHSVTSFFNIQSTSANLRNVVGSGWTVSSNDITTTIPENCKIGYITGNVATLTQPVTVNAGTLLRAFGQAVATYAVSHSFESIHGNTVENIITSGALDGAERFRDGETVVFYKQEQYNNTTDPDDGWRIPEFSAVVSGWGGTVNRRAGIWRITIDDAGIVRLIFELEVVPNQVVKVVKGVTWSSSFIFYDTNLYDGRRVPGYTAINRPVLDDHTFTRFDEHNTSFWKYKDEPITTMEDSDNKYIKFPNENIR